MRCRLSGATPASDTDCVPVSVAQPFRLPVTLLVHVPGMWSRHFDAKFIKVLVDWESI